MVRRQDYIDDMKSVGLESTEYLDSFIRRKIGNSGLIDIITWFLKRRKAAIIRPWIVKNSFNYFSESLKNNQKFIPLSSAAELENISQYQSNMVYDNKYMKADEKEGIMQIIASFINRNFVDDILFEEYTPDLATKLSAILRKIDIYGQLGQYKELSALYYKEGFDFSNLETYIHNYLEKSMFYGGAWISGLILAGYVLANGKILGDDKNLEGIIKFGILTGTAMNIINDISDYALFENEDEKFGMHYKRVDDQFKDIENRRILIPYFYAICQAKKKNENNYSKLVGLIGSRLSIAQKKEIFNLIKKYNGLSFSYTVARIINNRALRELGKIDNKNRKEVEFFRIMSSMVENNKFLHYYRSKQAIKRITINPKIKRAIKSDFFRSGGIANGMASDFLKV